MGENKLSLIEVAQVLADKFGDKVTLAGVLLTDEEGLDILVDVGEDGEVFASVVTGNVDTVVTVEDSTAEDIEVLADTIKRLLD